MHVTCKEASLKHSECHMSRSCCGPRYVKLLAMNLAMLRDILVRVKRRVSSLLRHVKESASIAVLRDVLVH